MNRKSKTCPELSRRIQNPKWLGLSVIALVLMVVWGCGSGAATEESSEDWFSRS